jgi:uncharacterized membrane protein
MGGCLAEVESYDTCNPRIAPSWDDIGQLGAIAAIRTVLDYFLGKDIAEYAEHSATA